MAKILQIEVEPFQMTSVLFMEMEIGVSNHGRATVRGYISEENAENYWNQSYQETRCTITGIGESGERITLFCGITEDLQIIYENGLHILEIQVISYTKLMDLKERTRTFQEASMLYSAMLKTIGENYEDSSFVMTEGESETLRELVVQYSETDWEFINRMATHFQTVILPEYQLGGEKYYFGVPEKKNGVKIESSEYRMEKGVNEFLYKKKNKVELLESDERYYQVKTRDACVLGEEVNFLGNALFVHHVNGYWQGQELIFEYRLKIKNGFKVPYQYNPRVIGASLEGNITSVQADQVQVLLAVDVDQKNVGKKWFAYSTVYSSPDGTGWYAMPEKDDLIRLYFPTQEDPEGYVISSVHLETSNQARSNPDYKSIRNKYDKEVLFTPNSLILKNNKASGEGELSISLLDDEGIVIRSDKMIRIETKDQLEVISQTSVIEMIAKEELLLKQAEASSILMKENISLQGAQLRVEE